MKTDKAFEQWWYNEGSGLRPLKGEDAEMHVKRVCRIAWEKSKQESKKDTK